MKCSALVGYNTEKYQRGEGKGERHRESSYEEHPSRSDGQEEKAQSQDILVSEECKSTHVCVCLEGSTGKLHHYMCLIPEAVWIQSM